MATATRGGLETEADVTFSEEFAEREMIAFDFFIRPNISQPKRLAG